MPFDPRSLPRDPDRLIGIIIELRDENARLQAIMATLKRAIYGPRSERLVVDTAQLPLKLDDVVITSTPTPANDDDAVERPADQPSPRPKATRNIGALPKHLPRYEVVIEPESMVCPCCQGT